MSGVWFKFIERRWETRIFSYPPDHDLDVARAVDWFFQISRDPGKLLARVAAARSFFIESTGSKAGRWSTAHPLDAYRDKPAMYLSQAIGLLGDRRAYDLDMGARVIPFFKMIGSQIQLLREMKGADARGKRMLSDKSEHPDSGLFEIVAALRYAREPHLVVEFIPEKPPDRTADFLIHDGDLGNSIHVECKRLRQSDYERIELAAVRSMLDEVNEFVHAGKLSLSIDATFSGEAKNIPKDYLLDKLKMFRASRIAVAGAYPWRDDHGHGAIQI